MPKLKLSKKKSLPSAGELPLVSIIITNYNYGEFLPRAIESALQQTYPLKELIVVDDGSTDNSRQIINSYGNKLTPVFQENRGMVPATNVGFSLSQGEVIFFLDADDIFFPHKVEEMVKYFLQVIPQNPAVLIFHRLEITTDEGGIRIIRPRRLRTVDGKKKNNTFEKLSDPESAYQYVQKWGFLPFIASRNSGLSLTRSLARCLFPLPEERALFQGRLLVYGSMLLGSVYGTSQVLGSYIIHKDNATYNPVWAEMCGKRGQIMENFLNDTLQKMNKKRIASFYDSPRAQLYYNERGRTKGLLKLAYKIPARCFCLETIWFSLQILWYCFKLVVGIKKRPWHTLKQKMLVKTKRFN